MAINRLKVIVLAGLVVLIAGGLYLAWTLPAKRSSDGSPQAVRTAPGVVASPPPIAQSATPALARGNESSSQAATSPPQAEDRPQIDPTEPTKPGPGESPQPPASGLTEEQFIEVSSTIVLGVTQIQNEPNAKELLVPLMEKALKNAGITLEQYTAFAERVQANPAWGERVGQAILERVDKRTTPELRMKAPSVAEASHLKLQEKQDQVQEEE